MIGPIEAFMTEDHARLDALLREAAGDDDAYRAFRGGLLRHIAMEEKVLLPFARAQRGTPLVIAAQLRADHSRIARLLVQSPTRALIDELCKVLEIHNGIEEGPEGLYATCDALAGDDASAIVEKLRAQPTVPLAPYYDGPLVRRVK
jgi:hypothetical protein